MLKRWLARLASLPTPAKLLLILSAAVLPIGLALVFIAQKGISEANSALRERTIDQARLAARSIEALIGRNALALRIAANGLAGPERGNPCLEVQRSLAIAPAVAQHFLLSAPDGRPLCQTGDPGATGTLPLIAPGDLALAVSPTADRLMLRVGVAGGMATASLPLEELRATALAAYPDLLALSVSDGQRELELLDLDQRASVRRTLRMRMPIAGDRLALHSVAPVAVITTEERLILLLPVLMWIVAAILSWLVVTRLLILPLRRLQRAVSRFQPGDSNFVLPEKAGPATEIQELRDAFGRAVARVERSEQEMAAALEGQRRLVREVHHRVKNNLQVVASLLNIHGRSAETAEAKAAYAAIGRRVGALSIVHRNHFAEMEENRGISLRPLLSELAAELRAGAPEQARGLRIDLDMEGANTTQDVAVSVAFLITEIVEFAMLRCPDDPVEISLRRNSDLTARLALTSPVLVPDSADEDREKMQFERIVAGLAKQLRSDLDRKLGRYSVDLPVFPPIELA